MKLAIYKYSNQIFQSPSIYCRKRQAPKGTTENFHLSFDESDIDSWIFYTLLFE